MTDRKTRTRVVGAAATVATIGALGAAALMRAPREEEPERVAATHPALARYLDALVRGDLAQAHEATTLPSVPKRRGVADATGPAHHAAAAAVASWTGTDDPLTVHVRSRDGATTTRTFELEGGAVRVETRVMRVSTARGPLPGLAVDGERVRLARPRVPQACGWFGCQSEDRLVYRVRVIDGVREVGVPAGPVTAPFTGTVDSSAARDVTVALRLSAAARDRARTAIERALTDGSADAVIGCDDDLGLGAAFTLGEASFTLIPRSIDLTGRPRWEPGFSRAGWAVRMRGDGTGTSNGLISNLAGAFGGSIPRTRLALAFVVRFDRDGASDVEACYERVL